MLGLSADQKYLSFRMAPNKNKTKQQTNLVPGSRLTTRCKVGLNSGHQISQCPSWGQGETSQGWSIVSASFLMVWAPKASFSTANNHCSKTTISEEQLMLDYPSDQLLTGERIESPPNSEHIQEGQWDWSKELLRILPIRALQWAMTIYPLRSHYTLFSVWILNKWMNLPWGKCPAKKMTSWLTWSLGISWWKVSGFIHSY